jgi:integrase
MPVRTYTDSKGRRRYAVEFELKGDRIFRRLPAGASKAQATELETRLRGEAIDGLIGRYPNVSLATAIDSWLADSVARQKASGATGSHAAQVKRLLGGDESIAEIPGVAERIRAMDALAPATRNRRLCILKATAKYAYRQAWTGENYGSRVALLPEKKYQRREVTPDMARALIAAATTKRAKALIALSAYTGLRLGEVVKLRRENIHGDVLHILDTKNGTDRIIPILAPLKPHLSEIPFTAGWRNVYRGFLRARERSGLDVRYHDLRHMVGTALHDSGADLRRIAGILGHKSLQTSARYTHPSEAANRAALERALLPPSKSHQKRSRKTKATKKAA